MTATSAGINSAGSSGAGTNSAAVGKSVLDQLQAAPQAKTEKLGKNAFLELMITQLQNQDPLSPQQNGEFISQLAQFSSVEGLNNLNDAVSGMATSLRSTQALQASTLVGRTVVVPGETALFDGRTAVTGNAVLTDTTASLRINVTDDSGAQVNSFTLGPQPAGNVRFGWDGRDGNGAVSPAGRYHFVAQGLVNGKTTGVGVELGANVDSVNVSNTGEIVLNVAGVGAVKMSDVKEIR